jgi:NAD(P)H dehydrogenase (quinone)
MSKILICHYSRTGHTEHMAEAIAEGARQVAGATTTVAAIDKVAPRDLLACDAVIVGSPTYYGTMAWQIKQLFDESVSLHGQLAGKVGGAFASSANIAGGNETTILDILNALLIHGMIIQGMPMGDHYGPVAIGDVDKRARTQCVHYGKTLAELTVKLHGKS